MRFRRAWFLVIAVAAGVLALERSHAWRTPEPRLPGVCDRGIVLFCADPSWAD